MNTLPTPTLYRATFMHTPLSPFEVPEALHAEQDGGVLVASGSVVANGDFAALHAAHPSATVQDLRGGVLLPGFIDTHVHLPQVRIIGGLGLPLLEWLDQIALPEEARMQQPEYARAVAGEFVSGLLQSGTTTALVFGSHFAQAVDTFFEVASYAGLRAVAGQVVSDRMLRPELHTTPERAYAEGRALAEKWHGKGRNLYAVTPRFSFSASEGILDACAALLRAVPGARFTSHINENPAEIATVRSLFSQARDYLDTYERAGLLGRRSVLAHNVHPTDRELGAMARHQASAAHCPCSNCALGSGLFPLRRHLAAGVHVSLGSDVGGGTGFSLLKEGLQAAFVQQLQGENGQALTPAHLLYLCTLAGARALDMQDLTGDFSVGKQFDAVLVRPQSSTLSTVLAHAPDTQRALAVLFSLGSAADTAQVWIGGDVVYCRNQQRLA